MWYLECGIVGIMTRTEAIARITAALPQLSDERVQTLAEIVQSLANDAGCPNEDDAARGAIANGIAQGHRGEFATDAEVAEAYARFRRAVISKAAPSQRSPIAD